VPAAYVVAGGCDWPLPPAVSLSNNGIIALRALRQFTAPYILTVYRGQWSVPLRPLRKLDAMRFPIWAMRPGNIIEVID